METTNHWKHSPFIWLFTPSWSSRLGQEIWTSDATSDWRNSHCLYSSREAAKESLKTHELNFIDRPWNLSAHIMFYNRNDIAFSPYGDYWRQMRKVCTLELLSAKRVKSFRSIRKEEVSKFIKTIYSKAGSPINLSEMMYNLSIGITARTSVGTKCRSHEALLPILKEVLEAIVAANIIDLFPSSKLFYLISKATSRLVKTHQEVDKILENIINEHRFNKEVTQTHDQEDEAEDDVLLNLQKHGYLEFPLTTNCIKAIILQMFAGGSETSSALWEWTMSELLINPLAMKKAQDEVRQVFNNTENVDETGLHNLKFLKLVIKETLRLHPPAPLIVRECIKTCKMNGYDIQAKSNVMINAWALGRDSDYWVEAEKFYPERFLQSSIDYKGTDFELIPFGAGRRMCPGIVFGITNIEHPLAQLLYHFDWKLPNGAPLEDLDMKEVVSATVKRKHHLNLIPIPYVPSPLSME